MNYLDLAFLAGCVLAAIGGWRLGFIRRVTGWVGLLAGAMVVSRLLPVFMPTPTNPSAGDLAKSLGLIALGGIAGQALGHLVGGRLRGLIKVFQLGLVDSAAGGVVGVVAITLAAWMILPAMAQIPGWPADATRSSTVAGRLTRALGDPPDLLAGVSDSLGVEGFSAALDNVRNQTLHPVAPADQPIPAEVLERVRRSVVKLSGPACGKLQSGSGFVVAPGLVATNAHVVAGSERLSITGDGDLEVRGTVRYLDTANDIALVAAPELDRAPLPLTEPTERSVGSILGYPGGGPLVVQPYTVAAVTQATSRDIYDANPFTRDILILGSRIGPGDSGGPLVDPTGSVTGIAFGIAPDDPQTAYAIPSDLLSGLDRKVSPEPLATGACRS